MAKKTTASKRVVKDIYDEDYYAKKFFGDQDMILVSVRDEIRGICPFCGGNITSHDMYEFRSKSSGVLYRVHVSAFYGICSNCGAI